MATSQHGPAAGLPAGFARWPGGTTLERGHTPGQSPNWFGPAIGATGTNRFDPPHPRAVSDPGTCYLAAGLVGVLHERVFRGVLQPQVSASTLSQRHATCHAMLTRDLVLLDLVAGLSVHGLQLHNTTAPPLLAPSTPLRYPATQRLAATWAARNAAGAFPVPGGRVDGILYVSRFGASELCIALWDLAATALSWGTSVPLGRHPALRKACTALGVLVVP